MKKVVIVILSVILLYVVFVFGQLFTLYTQQIGVNPNNYNIESTVFLGNGYHRITYYNNVKRWWY